MSSLRRRIALAVPGIASAVVLVAAIALWFATRAVLFAGVDGELAARLERWSDVDDAAQLLQRLHAHHGDRVDPHRYLEFVDALTGRALARSPSLPDDVDLAAFATAEAVRSAAPSTVALGDGRPVRLLVAEARFPSAGASPTPARLVLANDLEPIDSSLRIMAITLAALWAVASILAWAAGLGLRSAILRPLDDLAERIDALHAGGTAERLPATTGPDELRGVVVRLNGLLARIEDDVKREQDTIASIAHELRTPVAALRTRLEFRLLAEIGGDEAASIRESLATVLRMQAMVSNLLLLARIEAGREPLRRDRVVLAELIDDVVEPWLIEAERRGQTLVVEHTDPTATIATSREHLRLIVDNLVGNAVAHGAAGILRVTATGDADFARVLVDNALRGPLEVADLGRPFFRGDAARTADGHSGLGLALCHRLARLLDIAMARRAASGRLVTELEIPLTASAAGPQPR